MGEVAAFLVEHVGAAAVVVLLGFLADYFSTPLLKSTISGWLQARSKISFSKRNIRNVLRLFLDGFLHRIFGSRLFSLGFFLRSSLVTLLFIGLALLIQFKYYDDAYDQFLSSPDSVTATFLILGTLFLVNCFIDYISNIQTISLLRMAAASGRVVDAIVVFFADISLTITLFTMLFPVGMIGSILVVEAMKPARTVTVSLAANQFRESNRGNPFVQRNSLLELTGITQTSVGALSKTQRQALSSAFLVPKGWSQHEVFQEYIKLLESKSRSVKLLSETPTELSIEIQYGALTPTLSVLKYLYYTAFRVANVTRDSFTVVMRLEPMFLDFNEVFSDLNEYFQSVTRWLVRCDTGEIFIIDAGESSQKCNIISALAAQGGPDPFLYDRMVTAGADHFPISPFFFTSFASSILYYTALLVIGFGILSLRIAGKLFATKYLETTTKPFALLGFVAFVFVESIVLVVKSFT